MRFGQATIPIGLASILMLAACANELDGPEPRMSAGADTASSQPSFACNEQEESWIVLRGDGFSPLVVDTIDGEEPFSVTLPRLHLLQRSDVDGVEVERGTGFSLTLESLDGVEDGDIKWINSNEMHFRVRAEHELVPGVYDVDVENANGARSLQESAFGILPRPTLSEVRPDLLCLAQGERGLIVDGSDFLVKGQQYPTVVIDGEQYQVAQTEGCRSLPEIYDGHQLCDTLHIVIGADQHEPGSHAVRVENIAPAACHSTDAVELHVVPAPTVAAIADNPVCTAQFENSITLQGTGFLRVGELLPEVTIGGESFAVEALAGCAPLSGLEATVETCTTATLTLPTGALAEAGVHGVSLLNPEPAGCHSEEPVTLTVAAPPEVATVTPQPICAAEADQTLTVTGTNFLVIDGRLPIVHVGDQNYQASAADDCAPVTIYNQTAAVERCASLEFTVSQSDFNEATPSVTVTNPDTAACTSVEEVDVRFVPPPTLTSITPQPVCAAQNDQTLTATGTDFLVIDGRLPTINVGGQSYEATAADGCEPLAIHNDLSEVERCTSLEFVVSQSDFEDSAESVTITNPETAACTSVEDVDVRFVPAPSLTSVTPQPICTAEAEQALSVAGTNFLVIDGRLPTIQVGAREYEATSADGCEAIAIHDDLSEVERCTTLEFVVAQDDFESGAESVVVTNPESAACSSVEEVDIRFVPAPTLVAISPQPICTAESAQTLTATGADFLVIDGNRPTIHVGMQAYEATAATGCESVAIHNDSSVVERCTGLEFTVAQNDFAEGPQSVTVTNPQTAACSSVADVDVQFVTPPTLASISETFACVGDGGQSFTITGEGFVAVNNDLPVVMVGAVALDATAVGGCLPIPGGDARECTTVTFEVAQSEVATGLHDVYVINALPAACQSPDPLEVFIAGPPHVASADPAAFCSGASFDGNVTLHGDSFLVVDGTPPTVEVNGTPVAVSSAEDCVDLDQTITSCNQVLIEVPVELRGEDLTVTLTNAAPADCGVTAIEIVAEPTPQVASVTPLRMCTAGGTLQIDGTDFHEDMIVRMGGQNATEVVVTNGGTRATATFDAGIQTGLHSLLVTNPTGCSDTFETEVRVVDGPLPFYADPEVTWNGMSTQVTIYASGVYGGTIAEVYLVDEDGNETLLVSTFDADRPNTVQAIVPAEILPENATSGEYSFRLVDDVACSNFSLEPLLTVVDELTVAVDAILPPFGHTDASTSVIVTAEVNPTPPLVQFVATPRVYLNPLDEDQRARELSAVRYIDATELGGIVPEGLAVGFYQVIVINPDGTVGVADDPFRVTAEPPPLVDSVSPGAWIRDAVIPVLVTGTNFRDPLVEVTCFGDGVTTPNNITVDAWDAESITLSVDTSGLEVLSVCVMRVTNTDDDTYGEYGPITVTNPNAQSGNFLRFSATTELIENRRGLVTFASAPARESRYIYAIGGDDGVRANAKANGEFAALDRLGAPQTWNYLPYELPAGRTLSQALRLDDFVYLAGGHDGENVSDEVLRAQVLNPLEVPRITNIEFDFAGLEEEEGPGLPGQQPGLDPGVYYYRVSAVYAANDPVNPDGESLASDPQTVRVPPIQGVQVTIGWTPPPIDNGIIAEYRIYRNMSADSPYGDESLIGTVVPGQGLLTFLDDGTHVIDDQIQPLPLGSLGKWHQVATLNHPRYSPGLASAVDPLDATVRYIYASGGHDGTALRNDYEFITVTTDGPRKQAVTPTSTAGATNFATPRAEFALLAANPQNANRLSETHLFAMHGSGNNHIDVAEVLAGGLLSVWTALAQNQRPSGETRSGYAAAVANNQIFLVGGGHQAKKNSILCGPGCPPPTLNPTWTASAQAGETDRYLAGYVASRGFLYTIAGVVDGLVTRSTDYTVLGGTP